MLICSRIICSRIYTTERDSVDVHYIHNALYIITIIHNVTTIIHNVTSQMSIKTENENLSNKRTSL